MTIESVAVKCLRAGLSVTETLSEVKKVFPNCETTKKCIYYYSSKYKIRQNSSNEVDESALEDLMRRIG